jgi:hypothetical protein
LEEGYRGEGVDAALLGGREVGAFLVPPDHWAQSNFIFKHWRLLSKKKSALLRKFGGLHPNHDLPGVVLNRDRADFAGLDGTAFSGDGDRLQLSDPEDASDHVDRAFAGE